MVPSRRGHFRRHLVSVRGVRREWSTGTPGCAVPGGSIIVRVALDPERAALRRVADYTSTWLGGPEVIFPPDSRINGRRRCNSKSLVICVNGRRWLAYQPNRCPCLRSSRVGTYPVVEACFSLGYSSLDQSTEDWVLASCRPGRPHQATKPLFKKKWLLQPFVRQIDGKTLTVPLRCCSTLHRGHPSSKLRNSTSPHPHGQFIATLHGTPSSVIR